jgi:aminoglycoside phosphotransferase (APT) family kinase protein
MGAEEPGPWGPLTVASAVALFQPATFRWWLAGGHALEAHVGRRWRRHDDLDIGINRTDVGQLREVLDGWDVELAAEPSPDAAWAVDILIGDLPADHSWQTTIAAERARLAVARTTRRNAGVQLLASGRSSQAWRAVGTGHPCVVSVPISNSGRLISYRSEVAIGDLLAAAGHPVSRWDLEAVDDVECAIGTILEGSPVTYGSDWTPSFASSVASVLRDLHHLPVTGWGPLANTADELSGTSESANDGIVDRWSHAVVWPFADIELTAHPLADLDPDLVGQIDPWRDAIVAAAAEPFGLVHSDLHHQHLLHVGGELTGLLDFGDAFIGSTAWDVALIHWYYGADNAARVTQEDGTDPSLFERGALLAVAVGCCKVAKTPHDRPTLDRLRLLVER